MCSRIYTPSSSPVPSPVQEGPPRGRLDSASHMCTIAYVHNRMCIYAPWHIYAAATAHPGGAVTGPFPPCRHPSDKGRHRIASAVIPHVPAPAYICSQAYICLRCHLRQFLTRVPLMGYPTHFGHCLTTSGPLDTNAEGPSFGSFLGSLVW